MAIEAIEAIGATRLPASRSAIEAIEATRLPAITPAPLFQATCARMLMKHASHRNDGSLSSYRQAEAD